MEKTFRYTRLLTIIALGSVLLMAESVLFAAAAADKPNLIYIMVDDLGYGDLGCFGQKRITTPSLDKMAAEGIRLTDHYAGNTVCAPSRCSLMTGLHTGHAYVRGNKEFKPMGQLPLLPGTVTVASLLQDAGYRTALIGKWGLGGPGSTGVPNKQGFDFFFGYLCQRHAHNYYPEFLFLNSERVPLTGNKIDKPREDGAGVASQKVQYSHDLCAAQALDFIKRSRPGPFFLYLALTIPHANNEAGKAGMEVPELGPYTDKDWPEPQKGHAAMISRMDADVGRLLDLLGELGLDRKTLVIFTSDNGPHSEGGNDPMFNDSNGPLRGIKRDLYEGGIRVPTIARWPGKIAPGRESNHVSAFWDLLPTACDLAGVKVPDGLDGISYLPTLLGDKKSQPKHEYLYWEFKTKQAVRLGHWKGVRDAQGAKIELFNLTRDLGETKDVAGDHPDVVQRVAEIMQAAHVESPDFPLE